MALLILVVVVENEGFSGTTVDLKVNLGFAGGSFSRLGDLEDHSLTSYKNLSLCMQHMQENAQQKV